MKEKITTIDLFAGCGGLMEGFEQTGFFETLACVEWEKSPCENLKKRLNEKWKYKDAEKKVLRFDIQRTDELFNGWADDNEYGSSVGLDKLIGSKKVELIIGGPPCQAYSLAGRIRDEYGMKNDYRNYLFECYIKVVSRYKPKAFIFENVPGILSARPNGSLIIDEIREKFNEAGYEILDNLKDAVIDFTEYGVPQERKRIILLGIAKEAFGDANVILKRFYYEILTKYKVDKPKTVFDAIGELPKLFPIETTKKQKLSHSESNPPIPNHIARWQNERDIKIFRMLAEDIASDTKKYVSSQSLKNLYTELTGRKSNVHKYHVLRWNKPSNLIPAHLYKDGLRHIHPDSEQARTITAREAARLQTFSDDYIFIGSQMDQFKMIGNAVPPKFSEILARAIYKLLFE